MQISICDIYCCLTVVYYYYIHVLTSVVIFIVLWVIYVHGRPQEFFQGGAQKICEGGPHNFFRQALKYAYRGGGSFDARRVFF